MGFKATDGSGANSFQGFRAFVSRRPPSYNNLYWVRFRNKPAVLKDPFFDNFFTGNESDTSGYSFGGPGDDKSRMLTYYANDVTIPSRQLTTGDAKTVGALYRYPTGTTFSEISINFTISRDLMTRMFFERWMNYITEDSGNRVSWYKDSVCNFMDIVKYERGGSKPTTETSGSVVSRTADDRTRNTVQFNKVSGVWVLANVFPFNISNVQLTNGPAATMSMEVSFYYERYRFYNPTNTGIETVYDTLKADEARASSTAVAGMPADATTLVKSGADGKLKS